MAIIGGAILPQVAGKVADASGLHAAFLVPMAAYVAITVFAMSAAKARVVDVGQAAGTVAH
jgi:FHS family L-fucose permease-like MFS transporter